MYTRACSYSAKKPLGTAFVPTEEYVEKQAFFVETREWKMILAECCTQTRLGGRYESAVGRNARATSTFAHLAHGFERNVRLNSFSSRTL